jgi:thioredoxin 1
VSLSSQATNLIVDYVKPTATLSSSRSAAKIGETATITVQLSEASSTFVLNDVTVVGGTVGTFVTVSSTQYTFVFTKTKEELSMRDVLSMMIRRLLGVFGIIPAVSDKIDQIADAAVDKLEEAIPAVKQIDEMLGATSQRNGSSAGSSATDSTNGIGEAGFNSQVLQSDLPVLVDFWAPWCGPCKAVSPALEELAQDYAGKINVVKINIDDDAALSDTYDVQSIPTIVFFKNGSEVSRSSGVKTKLQFQRDIESAIA